MSQHSQDLCPPQAAPAPSLGSEARPLGRPASVNTPPLGLRTRLGLAVSSGFLYFLAYPGIDLWPLAFFALTPLILALRGASPRTAAWLGWTAGMTMTCLGFYWLVNMLRTFSGFGLLSCTLFLVLLSAYQAGRIALLGWLFARGTARGWPGLVVFAAAFAASEYVYPLLFPWYYAATVHQQVALLQLAEWAGPITVGLALVPSNWAFAHLIESRRSRTRPALGILALGVLAPLTQWGYGRLRIQQVEAQVGRAPRLEIGVVQANMGLLEKRQDRHEGLKRHLALTRQLTQGGKLELVIWSETSVAGAVADERASRFYQELFARELAVPVLFGGILTRPVADARRYTLSNSALLSDSRGGLIGRYDKQFLLAFGEYIPWGAQFPWLYEVSPNTGRFTPGDSLSPLALGPHRISVNICYEDILPGFINAMMQRERAQLIVNLTNDAWYGDTTQPWIHLALAKFRAIEHRRSLIRGTNSGVSAVVDAMGRVTHQTPVFEQATLRASVPLLDTAPTVYERVGDWPWRLTSLVVFGFAFARRPSRRLGGHHCATPNVAPD